MIPEEKAREEEAMASAERAAIAELLETGFLHVHSFTGEAPEARLTLARNMQERLRSEGREVMILHRMAVTRVYAKRPKQREAA